MEFDELNYSNLLTIRLKHNIEEAFVWLQLLVMRLPNYHSTTTLQTNKMCDTAMFENIRHEPQWCRGFWIKLLTVLLSVYV